MTALPRVLVVAIALLGPVFAARAEFAPDAAAALDRAIARFDLGRKGTPPIRLRARVMATNTSGEIVAGNYQWLWLTPTTWREEIAFPGFWEVSARSGEKSWRKRKLEFTSQEITWAYQALHFADRLRRQPTWSAKAPERKRVHGVDQSCIRVDQTVTSWRRWCFDAGSFDLIREEGADDFDRAIVVTYGDWRETEGKRFPGTIVYTVDKRKRIELEVVEFDPAHETDPASFLPPEGADDLPACDSPIRPAVLATVLQVPNGRGSAAVEARIGSDGKVKRVRAVSASSPEFARSLAMTVAAATFNPATCDGRPVEIDQLIRQTVR